MLKLNSVQSVSRITQRVVNSGGVMEDVFDSSKTKSIQYKRLPKRTKEEGCENKNSNERYRPINTSVSSPLSTIQKLATRTVASPTKDNDCTKKSILSCNTPKISSQKADVRRWLFAKNRKVEIAEKNTENKSPRKNNHSSISSGAKKKIETVGDRKTGNTFELRTSNITFRRGQTSNKLDGQIHTPESLSRSSSITNLNVAEQTTPKVKGGGSKPRKSASRDKLDKIGVGTGTTDRKNERKGVTKNNNKFDSGDTALALDSLHEIESLRAQLHQMATEKSNLALELGEQKGHIHSLQHQIENLKMYQEQSNLQLEQLTEENTALRNRLRDVAHSPLSDNEKQQLLYESHRHHNSAPASIATNPLDDGTCGDVTACPTPDWDKHSSSNVSEVSVACLQDKINQMQETHYSTNEELQATLQELTDLQKQLTELQQENERLSEEKNLMFDSLCRQTERLKDTRQEVESLKTLLYREKNEPGVETAQEREEKLVDLLKSAQDEHESLLSKHEQMSVELQELRDANEALHEELKVLTDRNVTLESTLDAKHAEHKLLDQELALAKDQSSGRQIEINRLKDILENARTKINELEQDRALSDKSELDELLDNARKEKDSLESEVTHLKEQVARSKNEIEKLKEQVSILQEECKVTRNNAKTIQSDLEYKCEKLVSEKTLLTEQLHNFQDAINELQVQAQCQLEDKRNLSDVLAETQRNLSESERRIVSLQNELADVKKLRKDENEEWEKFQNDLLTSVRVANDFKTEAQQDLQKMIMENKEHRDKVRQLEAQLDKLKGESSSLSEMPEGRRNSQPFTKHQEHRRIFGSLPNILDGLTSDKDVAVKKTKRFKSSAHQKQLSLEEGKILNTLDKMYKEIDPNTPDDLLTTEQVVIRKLKTLYEDDSISYRPVAPRNKGDLAISKPLLDSVYSNPKLEIIAKNPDMLCLENDRFSWLGHKKFTDDAPETSDTPPNLSGSREETNPNTFYNHEEQFQLKRYSSKENLLDLFKDEETVYKSLKNKSKKRSSLKSSNSGSSSNYSQKKRVSFDEKRNSCFTIKEFLTYESLEDIYKSIDPHVPEQELTKEQRFALRVKTSCYNLGEKSELRKRPTFKKKKVTISWPTKESVMRNTKLRSIINDPIVRTVGENAEEQETVELRNLKRMRKYLDDTNVVLRKSELYKCRSNICKNDPRLSTSLEDVRRKGRLIVDRPFSSMENLPSDNTDQMGNSRVQIEVTTNMLPAKSFASSFVFSSSSSSVDNSNENLMKKLEDAPVVFVEHFEPEEVKFREKTGVQIREMSANSIIRNSQLTDDSEYTGRISFPDEEVLVNKNSDSRVSSFNCVEMSVDHENLHDRESFQEVSPSVLDYDPQQHEVDEVIETFNETIGITEFETHKKEERYNSVNIQSDDEKEELTINRTVPDELEKSISDAFSYLSNRISDISRESWEEEERMQVKAKYVEVVQEIKRKYSLQCPSDNSEEEEINIFSPNEGKIEVTKLSKENNNICSSRLGPRSEIFSHEKFVHDERKRSVKSDIFLGEPYLEKISLNTKENEQYYQKIQNQGHSYLPTEEKNFIKLIRQVHEEDFKEIDTLGYISDENIELKQKVQNRNNDCMQEVNSEICSVEMGQTADEPLEENLLEGSCDGLKHIVDIHETKNISKPENEKKTQEQTKRTPRMDDNSYNDSHNQYLESRAIIVESGTLSTTNQINSSIEEKNVVELFENLSKSEHDLISSLNKRNSRPISAINIDDIAFIEAMKSKYLKHNSHNAGHFDVSEISERVDASSNSGINTSICENNSNSVKLIHIKGAESESNKLCLGSISELMNEFLMNERNIHLAAPEISTLKENHVNEDKTFVTDDVYNEVRYESIVQLNNKEHNSVKCTAGYRIQNANYFEPEFISKKEIVISSPRNSYEHRNSSIFTRNEENIPSVSLSSLRKSLEKSSLDSISYEPVYENYHEIQKRQLKNFDNIQRKPRPLPRNPNFFSTEKREYIFDKTDIRKKNMTTENVTSMKPNVSVNYVKVESENHEPLPNYSKVMEKTNDIIGMDSKADSVLDRCLISYSNTTKRIESPSKTDVEISSSDFVSDTHSSNILVRKTKKFIKEGDQMEEFDETVGVSNIELENLPDFGKFDKDRQLIPEDLIDYANSESKITLFNNESKETNEYFEPCSRPQTSRQSSTPFRLSCYGEDSNESFDLKTEVSLRKSSEIVAQLKEKFENLADEQNDSKRTSITGKEYVEARRSNLPKLFKERDAYDLVFKTNSKYWFDNNSELERSDATIHQSTPSFEPSSSTTPLNITILDPVESKTNTNYQHLFESDTLLGRKPFHDGVGHLSELNLKTSIPCVDFTTLPAIEKESNASLFEYGLETEVNTSGKSDGETIGCFPKKKPT